MGRGTHPVRTDTPTERGSGGRDREEVGNQGAVHNPSPQSSPARGEDAEIYTGRQKWIRRSETDATEENAL